MAGRVEGKVAFISGIARGQGRSHAVRLAQEGADIIGIDVCGEVGDTARFYPPATEADLAETVRLVEDLDRRILVRQADVRDYEATKSALDAGVAELGRLDIVAGNAGIFQFGQDIEHTSEADWRDVLDVNLTGVFHTCKAAVPHLLAGGRGGSVTITSSCAGLRGFAQVGHYVAAKHGVIGLMRSLALELAPHSVRVNVIAPTNCDTQMIQNAGMYRLFAPDAPEPTKEAFTEASGAMMALPVSWVEPQDISNALLFLSSEEARYITGAVLPVDAGMMLK
jgi:SDR family mycofactocin-dependent oxidoreductase